ncbi:TetR/AcrR family transcriptional regulator, partial [Candidatus Hakubella thermalkaliphila]
MRQRLRYSPKKAYHNTSIEELMDSIGIAKSVLYYYFKRKEALFATIIEMGVSSFIAMLKEAIREESDIRGR